MTLIAAFSVSGVPLLFGDLLVTGPTEHSSAATPAAGQVGDFFGESGWGVSRLSQKVSRVSANCAVAWAGSWLGARIAIEGLRSAAAAASGLLSFDDVMAYLHSADELRRHDASFIGLIVEEDRVRQFHYNASEFNTSTLGTVFVSGTGAHAIQEYAGFLAEAQRHDLSAAHPQQLAVASATQLASLLLRAEHYGAAAAPTLRAMFGGAYEIAYPVGKTISKLPEITHVFWRATIAESTIHLTHPEYIVRQSYVGDHLLARSVRLALIADAPGAIEKVFDHRFIVDPMFATDPIDARAIAETMPLNSTLICHAVSVHANDAQTRSATLVRQDPTGSSSFSIIEEGGTLQVSFDAQLVEQIVQLARRYC